MLAVSSRFSTMINQAQTGQSSWDVFLNQNMMDDLADQLSTRNKFYPYPIDESNTAIVKISDLLEKGVLYPSQAVDKFVYAGL